MFQYYEISNQRIWPSNFITGIQIVSDVERPLKIYEIINHLSYILKKKQKKSSKSKKIDNKFLVMKQSLELSYVDWSFSTNLIIMDMLKKDLPPIVFLGHVTHVGAVRFNDEPL